MGCTRACGFVGGGGVLVAQSHRGGRACWALTLVRPASVGAQRRALGSVPLLVPASSAQGRGRGCMPPHSHTARPLPTYDPPHTHTPDGAPLERGGPLWARVVGSVELVGSPVDGHFGLSSGGSRFDRARVKRGVCGGGGGRALSAGSSKLAAAGSRWAGGAAAWQSLGRGRSGMATCACLALARKAGSALARRARTPPGAPAGSVSVFFLKPRGKEGGAAGGREERAGADTHALPAQAHAPTHPPTHLPACPRGRSRRHRQCPAGGSDGGG